jgi:hypothetical protein
MGYCVHYSLQLKISKKNRKEALRIFNYLHTDEMLEKHARGGSFGGADEKKKPVRERKWYSWVNNPEKPYETLKEAFENWDIVRSPYLDGEEDREEDENNDFEISGEYNDKLGQQNFLIEMLAPVLKNTVIYVVGEDNECFAWVVNNGQFSYKDLSIQLSEDDDE